MEAFFRAAARGVGRLDETVLDDVGLDRAWRSVESALALDRATRRALQDHGIARQPFFVLLCLRVRCVDGLSSGRLAAAVGATRPSLSRTLAALERAGLVERGPFAFGDGRGVLVRATLRGLAVADSAAPAFFAAVSTVAAA